MMLLIALGITVAFVASLATSLGSPATARRTNPRPAAQEQVQPGEHDEHAPGRGRARGGRKPPVPPSSTRGRRRRRRSRLLVGARAPDRDHAARPLAGDGRRRPGQGALAALAALLPDEAERVGPDGGVELVPVDELGVGDIVLVRPGGRVPADGAIVDGDAEVDESMVTGESRPVPKGAGRHGSSRARSSPTPPCGCGWRRSATTPPSPASSASSPRRRRPAPGPRCWRTARPRSSSTSRRRRAWSRSSCGCCSATPPTRSSAPSRCS